MINKVSVVGSQCTVEIQLCTRFKDQIVHNVVTKLYIYIIFFQRGDCKRKLERSIWRKLSASSENIHEDEIFRAV